MKTLTIAEVQKLNFTLREDPDFAANWPDAVNRSWGILECENPNIFVRFTARPDFVVQTGFEFVVYINGRDVGFSTARGGGNSDTSRSLEDGAALWVIDEVALKIENRIGTPGFAKLQLIVPKRSFIDRYEQELFVAVLCKAGEVVGPFGWRQPGRGRIEFTEKAKRELSDGVHIK